MGKIPTECSSAVGGVKLHHGMKDMMSWATGEARRTSDALQGSFLGLNAGDRVDWALQEDVSLLGSAGELMQALPSHSCYFISADVATFIYKQSVEITTKKIANQAAANLYAKGLASN